ncbi:glyoxalase/bleomycin resistance/dioxygenase family protein [Amycolatopsis rubida]|uniref:Glyoxalase/bleomycin resistance/dioxygenase family protein n=1 Tax=Amycolatopsis rubida TaxID=112413 RepID=A0ABX0BKU9_9PSEU|nr:MULTISPECIES: ArsI/CadI family heavy metal resistance metalloenzyme [Amycolatopsis]MYW91194.1 glyoxalase/bleomycin resistance/dioxygenase family protein [Amycolatopsis rubida]NEC56179.1 glyoxalase/bleomycin resistance/dioxygenase family protein [Amycolatopsis rubida]OAP21043.1 Cadmium-induced protein CadI [Amycolatopsis sp. M39]
MARVQLALRVGDLEGSIDFYSKLFGAEPAKLRPGYANFAIAEPALKLVLLEGEPGQATVMDHLGVEVESTGQVSEASKRLTGEGLETLTEDDTTCCYAVQDKVWVHGPGQEPWEVYTVKADSRTFGTDSAALATAATCRTPDAETGQTTRPEGCCS